MRNDDIGRKIKKASNQMKRNFDQFGTTFDLTSMQMAIIDCISQSPNQFVMQQDIENEFNIQRSTTSVILKRMEKKGFIFREKIDGDARQKSIHLTKKATDISVEISRYLDHHQQQIEEKFTEEELNTFEKVLSFFMESDKQQGGK